MAHKTKHDKFRLSFALLVRLLIFSLVVYFSINYLSSKNSSNFVLGDQIEIKPIIDNLYNKLPAPSRQKVDNFSSNPTVIFIEAKINQIKTETNGFPQKQINNLKKSIVQQIYQNVMKSIDNTNK